MSEGGDHDEGFLWGSQSWGFSNSDDNSGNSEGCIDFKMNVPNNKPPGSNFHHSQTPVAETTKTPAVPAPSSAAPSKKRGRGGPSRPKNSEGKGGAGCEAGDHETHIWTERERRKKMRNMFAGLHALLPQLPPKADKSTVVDEAVNYITTLQVTLKMLQKQKLDRLRSSTNFSYDPALLAPIQNLPFNSREAFLADQGSSSSTHNAGGCGSLPPSSSDSSPAPSRYPVAFQTWTSSNVVLTVCGHQVHFSICSSRRPGILVAIFSVLEKYKIEAVSVHVSSDSNRCLFMIQARVAEPHDQLSEAFTVEEVCRQAAREIMFWTAP